MGWPRNLVLVRHAESEGNVLTADERALHNVATHDYALTERGRWQADVTGAWLQEKFYEGFDINYVSYYRRSRETMERMMRVAGTMMEWPRPHAIYEDPRLAEAQRGMYHGMTTEQIEARWPEELARKEREGLYHYRPPGGENWPDVELRIHSFLGTLSRDCEGQDVVIVCHGHWFIMFQRLVERLSIDEAMDRYKKGVVPNASVTVYQAKKDDRGRARLVRAGETFTPWLKEWEKEQAWRAKDKQ